MDGYHIYIYGFLYICQSRDDDGGGGGVKRATDGAYLP